MFTAQHIRGQSNTFAITGGIGPSQALRDSRGPSRIVLTPWTSSVIHVCGFWKILRIQ